MFQWRLSLFLIQGTKELFSSSISKKTGQIYCLALFLCIVYCVSGLCGNAISAKLSNTL